MSLKCSYKIVVLCNYAREVPPSVAPFTQPPSTSLYTPCMLTLPLVLRLQNPSDRKQRETPKEMRVIAIQLCNALLEVLCSPSSAKGHKPKHRGSFDSVIFLVG